MKLVMDNAILEVANMVYDNAVNTDNSAELSRSVQTLWRLYSISHDNTTIFHLYNQLKILELELILTN